MLVIYLIAGLNLVITLISLALLRSGLKGRPIPGCGAQSGCDAVQRSRWAHMGRMPVAALGVSLYFFLALAAIAHAFTPTTLSKWSMAIGAIIAGGGALWFTLLQLVVIRRFCRLCMIIHGLAITACGLIVVLLSKDQPSAFGAIPLTVGIGGLVALAVLQTILSPKTFAFIPAADLPDVTPREPNPLPFNQSLAATSTTASTSAVDLVSSKVKLAPSDWPLLGSPAAPRLVAVMFDLTCGECRHLYQLMQQSVEQHPKEIAFLALPVPLHPACNPAACGKLSEDAYACEFAKLYLAVWLRAPREFQEFSRWLMAGKKPPPFSDARNRVQRFMPGNVSLALVDGQILDRLAVAVDLYRQLQVDRLPQILLEDRMLLGRLDSLKELREVLQFRKAGESAASMRKINRT